MTATRIVSIMWACLIIIILTGCSAKDPLRSATKWTYNSLVGIEFDSNETIYVESGTLEAIERACALESWRQSRILCPDMNVSIMSIPPAECEADVNCSKYTVLLPLYDMKDTIEDVLRKHGRVIVQDQESADVVIKVTTTYANKTGKTFPYANESLFDINPWYIQTRNIIKWREIHPEDTSENMQSTAISLANAAVTASSGGHTTASGVAAGLSGASFILGLFGPHKTLRYVYDMQITKPHESAFENIDIESELLFVNPIGYKYDPMKVYTSPFEAEFEDKLKGYFYE